MVRPVSEDSAKKATPTVRLGLGADACKPPKIGRAYKASLWIVTDVASDIGSQTRLDSEDIWP
eukprot:139294-Rhodomonas_salina.1